MVLHPVGPHSTAVYWRRRIVPIVVLVVVILLLAKACGGSSPNTTGLTTKPITTPTPTPAPITTCGPRKLTVTVNSVAANSTVGDPVRFTATVETAGAKACRLIVTPAQEIWAVTSGGSPVWTDAGCQPGSAGVSTVIRPHRLLSLHLKWDGTHTGSGCKAGTPSTAGTYDVTLALGATVSAAVPFVLTQA